MSTDPRAAYREAAAQTATPVQRVVLLYEQIIQDLQRVVHAMEAGNIELRCREIDHALRIVGQLQLSLDMEHGGEVAANLERFYNLLRANLIEAQIQGSRPLIEQQIAYLLSVREAWREVDRATVTEGEPGPAPSRPAAAKDLTTESLGANWSA